MSNPLDLTNTHISDTYPRIIQTDSGYFYDGLGNTVSIGSIGAQGFQGPRGDIGIYGPQGFQGPRGDIGLYGPQGFQGAVGSQGLQGPTNGDTWKYSFGENSTAVTNRFITTEAGIRSNLIGYVPTWDCKINAISFGVGGTGATAVAKVYINGVGATGYDTLLGFSSKTVVNTTFGPTASISTNNEISVYIYGTGVDMPLVNIHFERNI